MSAETFAAKAKRRPNPDTTTHARDNWVTGYTCHMAVIHWAFMELGDSDARANARVEAIVRAKCPRCAGGGNHDSIKGSWYGPQFCEGGELIADRASLYGAVAVGDVLITAAPQTPMHSMVVVGKKSVLGRTFVYVRGFNNFGTLGTGVRDQYDPGKHDIDKEEYWHAQGGQTVFGNGVSLLYRVPYANFILRAAAVMNRCPMTDGGCTYKGP